MSPSIIPDSVSPSQAFAPDESERTVTLFPRMTFNTPENNIACVNAQVEAYHALTTMARRYLPEAVGDLKHNDFVIIGKLDELIAGIQDVQARLARLEAAQ